MWHIYTMEYYSAIKRNEMEGIKWNESERKTNAVCYHLYVESKKYNKLVNITKKKQTYRYGAQINGYQWGEGREKGQYRGRELRGTNYYV